MDLKSLRNINNLLGIEDSSLQNILANNMSNIFCILCSKYVKYVCFKNDDFKILTTCTDCDVGIKDGNINEVFKKLQTKNKNTFAIFNIVKHTKNDNFVNLLYKHYTNMLQSDCNEDLKLPCIKALKMVSKHKPNFFCGDTEIWLSLAGHEKKIIRNALTEVVYFIIKNLLVSKHLRYMFYISLFNFLAGKCNSIK